jgi:sarcosine oxidase subunit gamma
MTSASASRAPVFQVEVLRGRGCLRLRSWLPEHLAGTQRVTLEDEQLPAQVGEVSSGAGRVLCVGPAHWLLVGPVLAVGELAQRLAPQAQQRGLALVDQSDTFAIFRLSGSEVREVMAKGCGLDLHVRSFGPGRCTGTRFAQIPAVIDCLEESVFELYVVRSYSRYVQSWLHDAALEFAPQGAAA